MTRHKRIALELLGPALLASGLVGLVFLTEAGWAAIASGKLPQWNAQFVSGMGLFVVLAYLIAGIPSIIYATVMEWRFAAGLDPNSGRTVWLSTFMGLFSGASMVAVATSFHWDWIAWSFLGGMGAAVGLLLGLVIKNCSRGAQGQE